MAAVAVWPQRLGIWKSSTHWPTPLPEGVHFPVVAKAGGEVERILVDTSLFPSGNEHRLWPIDGFRETRLWVGRGFCPTLEDDGSAWKWWLWRTERLYKIGERTVRCEGRSQKCTLKEWGVEAKGGNGGRSGMSRYVYTHKCKDWEWKTRGRW